MTRTPCTKCGTILHVGDARVTVSFTVAELIDLAFDRAAVNVRERLLCAASLLDEGEVRQARMTQAEADALEDAELSREVGMPNSRLCT